MKPIFLLTLLLIPLTACATMKRPSGNASTMSADTLCYRQAYAKKDPAYTDEIEARNLDCREILRSQGTIGAPQGFGAY